MRVMVQMDGLIEFWFLGGGRGEVLPLYGHIRAYTHVHARKNAPADDVADELAGGDVVEEVGLLEVLGHLEQRGRVERRREEPADEERGGGGRAVV